MKAYMWEGNSIIGLALGIAETEEEAQEQCIMYIMQQLIPNKHILIKELRLMFKTEPKVFELPYSIVTWGEDCNSFNWKD